MMIVIPSKNNKTKLLALKKGESNIEYNAYHSKELLRVV